MSQSTPPAPSSVFPLRLRMAREYRGLNQADLAKLTGMQASAISHFETGTRKPSFDNLRILADSLDVTTDYLVGRVDEFKALAGADRLHRHYESLDSADRRMADDLITMLAKRAKEKQNE
jgi:transcriptional regulator with XRE-family HTH domain